MKRQRLNYARILGIGLGISLAVHALVLGLGRLSFGTRETAAGPLNVITLPEPDPDRSEPDAASALAVNASLSISSGLELSEPHLPSAGPDLAEYRIVLAEAASARLPEPLVPQPRIVAAAVESGLTPIRVREPALLTMRDRGRDGGGGSGGIGILIGVGGVGAGGNCAPSHSGLRFTNRRIPVQFRSQQFALRPRR